MKRWAVLLGLVGAAAPAHGESEGWLCRHADGRAATWQFALDAARQEVAIDAPVNWTWMTRDAVLFLHYTTIGTRQYATQTYTLDRRSGRFEVCDFTGGADQPVACDARWQCAPATYAAERSSESNSVARSRSRTGLAR